MLFDYIEDSLKSRSEIFPKRRKNKMLYCVKVRTFWCSLLFKGLTSTLKELICSLVELKNRAINTGKDKMKLKVVFKSTCVAINPRKSLANLGIRI